MTIRAAERAVIRAALRAINEDGIAVAPPYRIGDEPVVQRPDAIRQLEHAIERLKGAMSRRRTKRRSNGR